MRDNNNSEPEAISEEEQEHDSRISAKMHLFLERMIHTACEEEGIDGERAADLMLCTAVGLYLERVPTHPREFSILCQSIAEDVLKEAAEGEILH